MFNGGRKKRIVCNDTFLELQKGWAECMVNDHLKKVCSEAKKALGLAYYNKTHKVVDEILLPEIAIFLRLRGIYVCITF